MDSWKAKGLRKRETYFNCWYIAGGIWFSLLEGVSPGGVYSGQDCFTIHQFMLKMVKAKLPGAPFSSASTVGRPALKKERIV